MSGLWTRQRPPPGRAEAGAAYLTGRSGRGDRSDQAGPAEVDPDLRGVSNRYRSVIIIRAGGGAGPSGLVRRRSALVLSVDGPELAGLVVAAVCAVAATSPAVSQKVVIA
jgi:hypothetical protein